MTVKELIKQLEAQDPTAEVIIELPESLKFDLNYRKVEVFWDTVDVVGPGENVAALTDDMPVRFPKVVKLI